MMETDFIGLQKGLKILWNGLFYEIGFFRF